jgi:hypothetical protein
MKRFDKSLELVAFLACVLLGLGVLGVARATEPTSSAASATDGSSASSKGGWLPPSTSSKKPQASEWDGASSLELPRKHCNGAISDGVCSSSCSAKVLREWVQVSCTRAKGSEVFMGARVLAGPADDVSLVDPPEPKSGDKGQRGFSLVFPVRRGDRRTIEIAAMLQLAWKSWTIEERLELVVSAMWLPNAARPVVTVY